MSERVVNLRDLPRSGPWRWLVADGVVRIDRRTRWGNPWRIGGPHPAWRPDVDGMDSPLLHMSRETVLTLYRTWLLVRLRERPGLLEPLRGKRLACWCAPLPCHGDVIAELIP